MKSVNIFISEGNFKKCQKSHDKKKILEYVDHLLKIFKITWKRNMQQKTTKAAAIK